MQFKCEENFANKMHAGTIHSMETAGALNTHNDIPNPDMKPTSYSIPAWLKMFIIAMFVYPTALTCCIKLNPNRALATAKFELAETR